MSPTTATSAAQAQRSRAMHTLALIGHPNVGKSVLFHALTGKYVNVSNFPGTTVDISRGVGSIHHQAWTVYDTPGVLSLNPRTDDERVARDLIVEVQPDVIVQVADAKNLAKSLLLTLELSEFNLPVVLALNMIDESNDRGIQIDFARLSTILGVPVVPTVAISGEGIGELKNQIGRAANLKVTPRYDPALRHAIENLEIHYNGNTRCERALTTAILAKDKSAWAHAVKMVHTGEIGLMETKIEEIRRKLVRPPEYLQFEAKQAVVQEIVGEVLSVRRFSDRSVLGKLGLWAMRPFPGYLIAGAVLFALYEFVGVFGAGTLVGLLEENFFGEWVNPTVTRWVTGGIPVQWIQELIIGKYGILTMALTYAFALILPIVTTFFLFFGFLEDSGYLPRLAVMMDRFFRMMGLNGRAVVPMVLGLGCDTMATVTTRILDTRKEKLILSLLLTLSVPCSAQLGAILGMAAGLSANVLLVWLAVVSGTMLLVGWGASRLLPGGRSPLLVEIPPLRLPKISNIAKKVKMRLKWYTKEVIPLFVLATVILFVLDKLKLLTKIEEWLSPVVVKLLGLPAQASEAFLIGFFRRDYGAAGFFAMAKDGLLTAQQVAVSMVVITLFMPCVAHLLITIKERGWRASAWIVGFVLTFALAVGGAMNWLLGVTSFLS